MKPITKALFLLLLSPVVMVSTLSAQKGILTMHQTAPSTGIGGRHGVQPLDTLGPVEGGHIYLFEVGPHGPNTAPFSLINCSASGVSGPDSLGNCYVVSDSSGHFDISGLYYPHCELDTSLVYLYATQGALSGINNNSLLTAVSLMPVDCVNLPTVSGIHIGDSTTVAAVFALAPFANSTAIPTDGFSTKYASLSALSTAFAAANALVSGLTGDYVITDSGTQEQMNALADVIQPCANTTGSTGSGSACGTLFSDATTSYITPTDLYQALLSMAQSPTNNVSSLFGLISSTPLYGPIPSSAPSSWVLPIPSAPTISSLSVSSGAVGDSVTISGSNLTYGSTTPIVVIGGVQATITGTPSSTSITVTVPTYAITGFIGVYPGNYASNVLPFTVTP